MPLFNVTLTRALTFLAKGETKDAVEKAARELAESPGEIEDWNVDDWRLDSVEKYSCYPGKEQYMRTTPDVALVDGEFLHPSDAEREES
jgi:hypothetical protein